MVSINREGETISKDNIQLKEQLQDQSRELAGIEDQAEMLKRQVLQLRKEN